MSVLLQVENLELAYGEVPVCRDLSFQVEEGEIVTLIGANGAGKSTTMRAVAGAMLPRRGRIIFDGQEVTQLPAHRRLLAGIALVPEGRRVFPALTVRENLEMGGFKFRGERQKLDAQMARMLEMFPLLRERAAQPAGTLSGGEQQMLALSRALMSAPRLLCMDEPSLGLAPLVVQDIFQSIRAANAAGTSILLVEQNARYALDTASRGYVMQTGAIIASGPCAILKQDGRVKEAYLGRR
ncbi:MAG: ABC transporter ATP-binding protein [Betaproteobacteria bacterium]|nr:ABC transporter ATP-binding protein [Betaproteobacteria bacterium]MSQ88577.1 ABC transporter ATP-binding protein [Betaproteobacteria bacterium]